MTTPGGENLPFSILRSPLRLEYDARLIEQAVFLAARRQTALERELHARIDPLYSLAAGAARESEFRRAYAGLFQGWKLDAVLPPLLEEPILAGWIRRSVSLCLVREAARRRDESADLLVRPAAQDQSRNDCTLVIQLLPASLLDLERLRPLLRRELLHVADMLEPRFGYERASLEGGTPRQNLVRDRYRVLWDIYVETRLRRAGLTGSEGLSRLREQFVRAFSVAGTGPLPEHVERIAGTNQTTHAALLAWAQDLDVLQEAGSDVRKV